MSISVRGELTGLESGSIALLARVGAGAKPDVPIAILLLVRAILSVEKAQRYQLSKEVLPRARLAIVQEFSFLVVLAFVACLVLD